MKPNTTMTLQSHSDRNENRALRLAIAYSSTPLDPYDFPTGAKTSKN